jgi:hypothetical protein
MHAPIMLASGWAAAWFWWFWIAVGIFILILLAGWGAPTYYRRRRVGPPTATGPATGRYAEADVTANDPRTAPAPEPTPAATGWGGYFASFWTWLAIAALVAGIVLGIWVDAAWWWLAGGAAVALVLIFASGGSYRRRAF